MTLVASSLLTLATEANAAHDAAEDAALTTLQCWRRAGEALNAAKAQVVHGEWHLWLADNCQRIPERTASAYMRIARRWPDLEVWMNRQGIADLSVGVALKWLSRTRVEPASDGDDFPSVDENLKTDYRCPCGCDYEWSGDPKPPLRGE